MQSVTSLMSLSRVTDIANVADVEEDEAYNASTLSDSTVNDIRMIASRLDEFRTELNYNLEGC